MGRYPLDNTSTLLNLLRDLSRSEDSNTFAQQALECVSKALGASHGKLLEADKSLPAKSNFWHGYSECGTFWTQDRRESCEVPVLPFSEQATVPRSQRSVVGDVLYSRQIQIIENLSDTPLAGYLLNIDEHTGSELIAFLDCPASEKRFAICLSHPKHNFFSNEHKPYYELFFELLSEQLNQLLQHESKYAETRFETAIRNAKPSIDASRDFSPLLELLLNRVRASACAVYFFSPDDKFLVRMGNTGDMSLFPIPDKAWLQVEDSSLAKRMLNVSSAQSAISTQDSLVLPIPNPDPRAQSAKQRPFGFLLIHLGTSADFETGRRSLDPANATREAIRELLIREHSHAVMRLGEALRDVSASEYRTKGNAIGALESAIDSLQYSDIHVWLREGSSLRLATPTMYASSNYRVDVTASSLVSRVAQSGEPHSAYGIGSNENPLVYPQIVPELAQSWYGLPIQGADMGPPIGVISCFDRQPVGENGSLLSKVDTPVIGALSTILQMALELQIAHEVKIGRQSTRSHEITLLISLIQSNVDILYDRLAYPNRQLPQQFGKRKLKPRTNELVYENIGAVTTTLLSVLTRDRVLSGKWTPRIKSQSLNKMIANSVAMLRTYLRRMRVEDRGEIVYDNIYVDINTDQGAFQEVLFNIFVNAVKYSNTSDEVHIFEAPNGDILVSNMGIGVPRGEESRIFDLGFQASNASAVGSVFEGPGDEYRDQGIGLHVCREVMKALGGNVVLEARGGNGARTVFRIVLPANGG